MTKRLPLTNSPLLAIVDDENYSKASQLKWWLTKDGYVRSTTRPYIFLHQLVLGSTHIGDEADHRNGKGLDCQRKNLRRANRSQQNTNKKLYKNNRSGFKGVYLNKRSSTSGLYEVFIQKDGVQKRIGSSHSPIEAAKIYDEAAKRLHGKFARLNFPMRFCREPKFPRLENGDD